MSDDLDTVLSEVRLLEPTDAVPRAALALCRRAQAAGMRARIDVTSSDAHWCLVRIQHDETWLGIRALYRNGKAYRAWTWPLNSPGVRRVGFRQLGQMIDGAGV